MMLIDLPAGPIFYPFKRACEMLGIGKSKGYELCSSGRLERVRIDGKSLITRRSVESLAAEVIAELEGCAPSA